MSQAPFHALLAEPMTPAQLFFSLHGRIPRARWWAGVLSLIGLSAYAYLALAIAGVRDQTIDGIVNALLLWPAVALSVKRWHDRNKSGWWVLIQFIPVIGTVWAVIENGLLRGTPGPNRFGDELPGSL